MDVGEPAGTVGSCLSLPLSTLCRLSVNLAIVCGMIVVLAVDPNGLQEVSLKARE